MLLSLHAVSAHSPTGKVDTGKNKPDTKRSVVRTMIATVLQEHRRGRSQFQC